MSTAADTPSGGHTPVLLAEVLDALAPRDGGIYVDGTFGAGGYSRGLLDAADCKVWGIDRDPVAIEQAATLEREFAGRFFALHGRYGDMKTLLEGAEIASVDGIALDLGVSSMQIDSPERGFSFRKDGPLDMRMDDQADGPSAADVVNHTPEQELADIIYIYGEERHSRRIAKAIVAARSDKPLSGTVELADIIRSAMPAKARSKRRDAIHPATRTFQALRIFVNDELGELDRGLVAAEAILSAGARLAVVSFHSLEDRRVKGFLRERSGQEPKGSRHLPDKEPENQPSFILLRARAIKPSDDEIAANPRARSARLRTAERTVAPAWGIPAWSEGA